MNIFQWVTFVLMFQAGTFILPYKLWQFMEGGLIAEFGLDANSRILLEVIQIRFQHATKTFTENCAITHFLKNQVLLMPCPFTGPKMFCAGPNILSQPKSLTAFKGQ